MPENTGDSERSVSHAFTAAPPPHTRFVTPLLQRSEAGRGRKAKVVATLRSSAGGLLSVREVAAFLGVSTATVYKLFASGDLPSVRVGATLRLSREALMRWVEEWEQR